MKVTHLPVLGIPAAVRGKLWGGHCPQFRSSTQRTQAPGALQGAIWHTDNVQAMCVWIPQCVHAMSVYFGARRCAVCMCLRLCVLPGPLFMDKCIAVCSQAVL